MITERRNELPSLFVECYCDCIVEYNSSEYTKMMALSYMFRVSVQFDTYELLRFSIEDKKSDSEK
jgi:hypothetical protein